MCAERGEEGGREVASAAWRPRPDRAARWGVARRAYMTAAVLEVRQREPLPASCLRARRGLSFQIWKVYRSHLSQEILLNGGYGLQAYAPLRLRIRSDSGMRSSSSLSSPSRSSSSASPAAPPPPDRGVRPPAASAQDHSEREAPTGEVGLPRRPPRRTPGERRCCLAPPPSTSIRTVDWSTASAAGHCAGQFSSACSSAMASVCDPGTASQRVPISALGDHPLPSREPPGDRFGDLRTAGDRAAGDLAAGDLAAGDLAAGDRA